MCAWKSRIDGSAIRGSYQIRARLAGVTIQLVAGLTPKAAYQASMFRTTPLTRYLRQLCGSLDVMLADRVGGRLAGPGLRPAEEDPLIAGQAVDHRRRLAVKRSVIGIERHRQAAEIGDILAHGRVRG